METKIFATNYTHGDTTYIILEQTIHTHPITGTTRMVTYGLTETGQRHYLSDDCPSIPTI